MGSVVAVHGSTFLDARSGRTPRFAAIPEGQGKTGTSALNHRQKETPRQEQEEIESKWLLRLAVAFVELASLAISQGRIGRAQMPH